MASISFNLPCPVRPVQRGFEATPAKLAEAAAECGPSASQTCRRVELPLAWPGVLSASVLTLVDTLGVFGVVLMASGGSPGENKAIAMARCDVVQAFELAGAAQLALLLWLQWLLSLDAVAASFFARASPELQP